MTKRQVPFMLAASSLFVIATTAMAQGQTEPGPSPADNTAESTAAVEEEEIVVTARRREESAQDVPLVVNAVTAEAIDKLNIRDFKDIQTLVPGLSMSQATIGAVQPIASLRGVAFDVNASGNNGTIEFYLNDSPLSAGVLFTSLFDVGQIEVLRGPQGTLRGRASPSGSITVTTRRPDLSEIGGYVSMTGNNIGSIKADGALNIPIIRDVLAIRVAGMIDHNEENRVHSLNNLVDPFLRQRGGRATLRFEPTDTLSFIASYTNIIRRGRSFAQAESLNVADPTAPASPIPIHADDRLAVAAIPADFRQKFEIWNLQAQWRFAGQRLNYVGSLTKQHIQGLTPNDPGFFFGAGFPFALQRAGQSTDTRSKQWAHELRLSSEERLFGMVDYVIGGLINRLEPNTDLNVQTPLFAGIVSPNTFLFLSNTPVLRRGRTLEHSFFGNVTVHLGEATEISGGVRHINYDSIASLALGGVLVAAANEDREFNTWIYSGSIKHRFSDNLMVYASIGSSWRPGSATNAIIDRNNAQPSPREAGFLFPPPEKSKSYEIGFKSDWLDRRLRVNVTGYHQTYDNFIFSSRGVFVAATGPTGIQSVQQLNPAIAVGVPAKVNGVEAEIAFTPTPQWNMAAVLSYSKSKIKNGVIPCNDYFPQDGIPDSTTQVPTFDQIITANNGETIGQCVINSRAGITPPFSATVQSEYTAPISGAVDGFVRGLVSYYGKSQNDPSNVFDDVDSYALVNLYTGIRDPDGAWEVQLFAKNILNTKRALTRDATPFVASFVRLAPGPIGGTGVTTYRGATLTAPREFGITARLAFGSR